MNDPHLGISPQLQNWVTRLTDRLILRGMPFTLSDILINNWAFLGVLVILYGWIEKADVSDTSGRVFFEF